MLTESISLEVFLSSFQLINLSSTVYFGLSKFNDLLSFETVSKPAPSLPRPLSHRCCVRQFTMQCVCFACVQRTRMCWWSSLGWREWSNGSPGWDPHRALLCLRLDTRPARSTCCTPCWRWVRKRYAYKVRKMMPETAFISLLCCRRLQLFSCLLTELLLLIFRTSWFTCFSCWWFCFSTTLTRPKTHTAWDCALSCNEHYTHLSITTSAGKRTHTHTLWQLELIWRYRGGRNKKCE